MFSDRRSLGALIALLCICGMFFGPFRFAAEAYAFYGGLIEQLPGQVQVRGKTIDGSLLERYATAQHSVPPGEIILSRDKATMLYHYGRNPIYSITDPGQCSPPPGMPYFQGPEAVAAYLLSHNIRYVAYAYANQGSYPTLGNLHRHGPDWPYIRRIIQRSKVALDRVLGELGETRARIYDDGQVFILDLKITAAVPGHYSEPNYFQLGKILVLAWADTIGFDRNKVWTDGHGVIEGIHYEREPQDVVLALNTFGYHPGKDDTDKLRLVVSVNGTALPFVKHAGNAYFFSLASVHKPIEAITIDTVTFEQHGSGTQHTSQEAGKRFGIDVDTIEIIAADDRRLR